MYMQSDGVAAPALSTAAVPVLAQGLIGDQGGGSTSIAARGVALRGDVSPDRFRLRSGL
jgi:hypothetical protein